MSAARRLGCLCLLCVAVVACGGSSGSGQSNRQQIMGMFSAIDGAMAKGDYATACDHFSQREQSQIVAGAKQAGLSVSNCTGAFAALIKKTGITRAQLAKAFAGSGVPKIQSLSVSGDKATVTYTNTTDGKTYTETDALVREDGIWKADRTVKRSGTS